MAVSVTESDGTVTVVGNIEVTEDLKVAGDVAVTKNMVVSGNVYIEGTLTEDDSPALMKRFPLVIPNVPLGAATLGYTVAPCGLKILSMRAISQGTTTGATVLTLKVAGAAHGETLTVADSTIYGLVSEEVFDTADTANAADNISIESDGGGTGTVNVTLICEAT